MRLEELKEIVDKCRDHFGVTWKFHFTYTENGNLTIQINVPEMTTENMDLDRKMHSYLIEEIVGGKIPVEIMRNKAGVVI